MRLIEDGLTQRGGVILGRLDGKMDWRNNPSALDLLSRCDAIVINGEGTLHHGRKKASWLMDVARHPVTKTKELALINTIYQANPDHWAPMLKQFTHLYARDGRSAAEMARHAEREVLYMGDLSMSAGALPDTDAQQGILFGDSVSRSSSEKLARLASQVSLHEPSAIIPLTTSLFEDNPYKPYLWRIFRKSKLVWRQKNLLQRHALMQFLPSEDAYIAKLRATRLSVTGRFHGICLSIIAGIPFVAVSSNSWKIEALFEDVGLDTRRLVPVDQLKPGLILDEDWSFSTEEIQNIEKFLNRTVVRASAMFDRLSA
ncbi:MAG: polysaccharide pyruvyl transferase family protein [Natronohydrobacter sp.]|nr:polysaccharide pyruvyl transferase family protein [Natronohydrobacter sp.]